MVSSFLYLTIVLAATSPLLGHIVDKVGLRMVALVSIRMLALAIHPVLPEGTRQIDHVPQRVDTTMADVLWTGVFSAVSLSFATAALAVSALVVHMTPLLQDAGMSTTAAARTVSIIGLGIRGQDARGQRRPLANSYFVDMVGIEGDLLLDLRHRFKRSSHASRRH